MSYPSSAPNYTQGFGSAPQNLSLPVYFTAAPTGTTTQGPGGTFQVGQIGIVPNSGSYQLLGFTSSANVLTANWIQLANSSGDLLFLTADSGTATPVGGTVTVSGGTTGLTTSASGSTMNLTGTLVVANGGTGKASLTAYALLAGGTTTTGTMQQVSGVGTTGQFLVSNGAAALPTWQTATPQLTVTPVAGTTQAMTSNNKYIANNASLTTFTLPATATVGDTIQVVGSALNTGGWKVTYTTGQIIWGPAGSTTITTGNAASAGAAAQCMTITCVVANTTWVITNNSGTITLT